MRILHVISSLNPAGGGPMEGVRQIGLELQESGDHQIEVVTMDAPNAPWLDRFPLETHALGPSSEKYRYSWRLVPWLKGHRKNYDFVMVNGIWQYSALGTWRALRNTDTPYYVFTHGMLDPWFKKHYPLKHLKKWLYWPWADYRVLRDAKAVLFTCEEERLQARRSFWLYQCQEKVVSYGTKEPPGDPSTQKDCFFRAYPALQQRPFLLFLSRIHEKKGLDLLLKAYAELIAASSEVTSSLPSLVLAGPCHDPAYLAELQQQAASLGLENVVHPSSSLSPSAPSRSEPGELTSHFPSRPVVQWLPMLSGDEKWGAFRAAEAFILPSHQENFGIAVAEALGCGLPVLISDRVNIWREILADGAGLIAPDTEAGTLTLLKSWQNLSSVARQEMRTRARQCFQQRFEIKQAAQDLLRLFRSCSSESIDPSFSDVVITPSSETSKH